MRHQNQIQYLAHSRDSVSLTQSGIQLGTLESPLDCKIKPVNPKENQSWIFMEGLMLKLKFQCFGHLMLRERLTGKDPDAGKDWRQEEKGTTEDEMVGWHHRLNEHEFEQALGVGDGQGSLACCSPWGCKESDMTERLNWTEGFSEHLQSSCTEQHWWASFMCQDLGAGGYCSEQIDERLR